MGALAGDRFAEVEVTSADELLAWFARHHGQDEAIWLITYKKAIAVRHVTHDQVLDALIAHGWCDGIARRIDDQRVMQLVSPRRTQPWARSYKLRAERLIREGRMQPAGQAAVDRAKATGAWDAMNDVDALLVPGDLARALDAAPPAGERFAAFPPSARRNILRWITSAKTEPTRQKRIIQTVQEAKEGRRVNSNG